MVSRLHLVALLGLLVLMGTASLASNQHTAPPDGQVTLDSEAPSPTSEGPPSSSSPPPLEADGADSTDPLSLSPEHAQAVEDDPAPPQTKEEEEAEKKVLRREQLLDEAFALRFDSQGKQIDENMPRVVSLFEEAAGLGSDEALLGMGEVFMEGYGEVLPNFEKAIESFRKAAESGYADAQFNLGFLLSLGFGGEKDEAEAITNYYFASTGGSHEASLALGYRHLHGYGVPRSCEAAIRYYTKVAEHVVSDLANEDVSPVVVEKARLSKEEKHSQTPEEEADVIDFYQHSAESGDVGAQVAMGQLHYFGARGVEQNHERAARYFRAAAEQGDPAAMTNLANMHVHGLGVKQNNETAFELFSRAAKEGEVAAQNGLGFMYMHGRGVKQSYKEAFKFFKKAADQGSADAQYNIGVLYFSMYFIYICICC